MAVSRLFPGAVERWEAILQARATQMDRAYADLGRTSRDFWDRRARNFHNATKDTVNADPLYQRLRERVSSHDTLLDVGAGTGRFTLALAPHLKEVLAIEPNAAMLSFLQKGVAQQKLHNVTWLQTTWQDAPHLQADYVVCSHVLYPIKEIVPFLQKLQAATRKSCFLTLRGTQLEEAMEPLWQHFHGEPRCLQPAYIHALDVLFELGIYANVEIVRTPNSLRYASLEVAENELIEQLILPDQPEIRQELRALLQDWLVPDEGALRPPQKELVSAILEFPATR